MQAESEVAIRALVEFRQATKFRCTEPPFRLLNPSPISTTAPLVVALEQCAENLEGLLRQNAARGKLRATIASSIRSVEKPFDTEDREYFAYYYGELGRIVGVNVSRTLNSWMYGPFLALWINFSRKSLS
jgi:Domain of unknown function (DUF4844)